MRRSPVATAETVQAERRRQRLAASEQERARWARGLHDETWEPRPRSRTSPSAPEAVGWPWT